MSCSPGYRIHPAPTTSPALRGASSSADDLPITDDSSWYVRALAAEDRIGRLEVALTTRPTIEQAKGLIMGVSGLDADAAFDVLVWVSQHANIKLALVADELITMARARKLAPDPVEALTRLLHELTHDRATGG